MKSQIKIAIASGKGGTGKTFVATHLAAVADHSVYIDCDVEEPNGHIFLKPIIDKRLDVEVFVPHVDASECKYCGRCVYVCQFNAILATKHKVLVFPELCHGCGSCMNNCPSSAIEMTPRKIGQIEVGWSGNTLVYTGILNIAEPRSTPIIHKLKGLIASQGLYILDSSPGTSCPMIETIKGSDYVVLVTESTPFGMHDLKLAVEVCRTLSLKIGVVINRAIRGKTSQMNKYCQRQNLEVLLEIPYELEIAQKYSKGELLVNDPRYNTMFLELLHKIQSRVQGA